MPWNHPRNLRKINIDGGAIAAALAGGPEADGNQEMGSAEGETADELAQTQAEKAGGPNAIARPVNYPHYKEPGFWSRLANPQGANQAAQFNNRSAMQQAEDNSIMNRMDLSTANELKVKQFDLDQQATARVLARKGYSPDAIKQIIASDEGASINNAQAANLRSGLGRMYVEEEPDSVYAGIKAEDNKQGYINRHIGMQTATGNAELPFVAPKSQALIDATTQRTREATAGEAYNLNKLKNDSIWSSVRPFSSGMLLGDIPSVVDSRPTRAYGITPEVRATPGYSTLEKNPETGGSSLVTVPGTQAQPPSLVPYGDINGLTRRPDTSGKSNSSGMPSLPAGLDPNLYEAGIDPATGKPSYRLKRK